MSSGEALVGISGPPGNGSTMSDAKILTLLKSQLSDFGGLAGACAKVKCLLQGRRGRPHAAQGVVPGVSDIFAGRSTLPDAGQGSHELSKAIYGFNPIPFEQHNTKSAQSRPRKMSWCLLTRFYRTSRAVYCQPLDRGSPVLLESHQSDRIASNSTKFHSA